MQLQSSGELKFINFRNDFERKLSATRNVQMEFPLGYPLIKHNFIPITTISINIQNRINSQRHYENRNQQG